MSGCQRLQAFQPKLTFRLSQARLPARFPIPPARASILGLSLVVPRYQWVGPVCGRLLCGLGQVAAPLWALFSSATRIRSWLERIQGLSRGMKWGGWLN